jgi:hypothetical protein
VGTYAARTIQEGAHPTAVNLDDPQSQLRDARPRLPGDPQIEKLLGAGIDLGKEIVVYGAARLQPILLTRRCATSARNACTFTAASTIGKRPVGR